MKTVTGRVVSSKPISLSKAASTLSSFLSTDNGASQALCAYLRRASASFNELKQLYRELKSSRSESNRKHRHHRSEVFSDLEAAVDNPFRSEASHELSNRIEDSDKKKSSVSESKSRKKRRESSVQSEDERVDGERHKDGKTTMASGGNGDFEDVVGEVEDKPGRRVEMDVEPSDRDKSTVAVENRRKKHKKKSEDGHGKIGDDERDSKSRISDHNGEIEAAGDLVVNNVARGKDRKKHEDKKGLGDEKDRVKSEGQRRIDIEEEKSADKDNDDGKDIVELPTKKKKKKKKKKKREEEDDDDLQNKSGGAIAKEEMPILDSKELKRKERKKRKNRDLEEERGDDGSEEQQSMKRRKGNL